MRMMRYLRRADTRASSRGVMVPSRPLQFKTQRADVLDPVLTLNLPILPDWNSWLSFASPGLVTAWYSEAH